MAKLIAAAILAFLAFSGYLVALNYRYEPIATPGANLGTIDVWDRWKNRVCIVSISQGNRPLCTLDELSGTR